ncbi:hypothetical protein [Streptomyces sp. 1222.5]|uniref:hypothetical protein n=1 Tax=Streptomyces sp. 1222.5 TaxID=1881026 RepID=UPI003D702A52
MDPVQHLTIVRSLLDRHPNLTIDLSWRVLEDKYFSKPGVRQKYALEVTSRINKVLNDEAFRRIALGENYFRLLGLDATAPPICGKRDVSSTPSVATDTTTHTLAETGRSTTAIVAAAGTAAAMIMGGGIVLMLVRKRSGNRQ